MLHDTSKPSVITLRNHHNNTLTRYQCALCGGATEKQDYHFELPEGAIVCDDCARFPEKIHERVQIRISCGGGSEDLEKFVAAHTFITEVVPLTTVRLLGDEQYYSSEDSWPNWMRRRIGLPYQIDPEFLARRYAEAGSKQTLKDNERKKDIKSFLSSESCDEYPTNEEAVDLVFTSYERLEQLEAKNRNQLKLDDLKKMRVCDLANAYFEACNGFESCSMWTGPDFVIVEELSHCLLRKAREPLEEITATVLNTLGDFGFNEARLIAELRGDIEREREREPDRTLNECAITLLPF